jgi:hypothetical protein
VFRNGWEFREFPLGIPGIPGIPGIGVTGSKKLRINLNV